MSNDHELMGRDSRDESGADPHALRNAIIFVGAFVAITFTGAALAVMFMWLMQELGVWVIGSTPAGEERLADLMRPLFVRTDTTLAITPGGTAA